MSQIQLYKIPDPPTPKTLNGILFANMFLGGQRLQDLSYRCFVDQAFIANMLAGLVHAAVTDPVYVRNYWHVLVSVVLLDCIAMAWPWGSRYMSFIALHEQGGYPPTQ